MPTGKLYNLATWDSQDASQNVNANIGYSWDEGQAPSTVNNSARSTLKDIKEWQENLEWVDYGYSISYVSATVFKYHGTDRSGIAIANRRVKAGVGAGNIYGTIRTVSISASDTQVTITWDSGSLDGSLSYVALSALSPTNASIPYNLGTLGRVVVITTSSSWDKPAGLKYAHVTCVGGGGGGGGVNTVNPAAAGGGGGGGMSVKLLNAYSLSSSVTATIGIGGPGGATSGGNGTNGQPTSFGSYLSATAGSGGTGSTGAVSAGGAGGAGSGGDLNLKGSPGDHSIGVASAYGGHGGASPLGGVGFSGLGGNGGDGGAYGGGGGGAGGAGSGATGGAGFSGVIVIEEFY